MESGNKILIVGECHVDLYYKNIVFSDLIEGISNKIFQLSEDNKIKSKDELNKSIQEIISDYHKKIEGISYRKRGGNGNNSAELMVKLGVPVKLLTVVGSDADWIIEELEQQDIDVSAVFKLNKPTPISTIIEDPPITKIFVAPNLKKEMNFDDIEITNELFLGARIVYFTPIAEKFQKIVHKLKNVDVISAFSIELQKIKSIKQLDKILKFKMDILFANLKDMMEIFGRSDDEIENNDDLKDKINEIDRGLQKYSHIRIYTYGKKGSFLRADNGIEIEFPIIHVKVLDQTGAGDAYSAGFLSKLHSQIQNPDQLKALYNPEKRDELSKLLTECGIFASYAAAYKLSTRKSPNSEELNEFINSLE